MSDASIRPSPDGGATEFPATPAGAQTIPSCDPIWTRVRQEAEEILVSEPALASWIQTTIIGHTSLEHAVAHRTAARLGGADVSTDLLYLTFTEILARHDALGTAFRADIAAIFDRDPACNRLVDPVLYFKGFHAVQTARFAHALWQSDRRDLALYLQSRSSSVLGVDIHPAARLGVGLMLDHASGIVIGETATVDNDVSILHNVTLGGSGKEGGDRHPKVRCGVLIGAGAKILGNIEIGACSRVAAGSVVLKDVPPKTTVAGVPAKVVGEVDCPEPSRTMNHLLSGLPNSNRTGASG